MVYSIDKLIKQCGRQTAMNILPELFIKINTASAKEKKPVLEYEYDGHLEVSSYSDINKLIQKYIQKFGDSTDMLNNLDPIVAIFYDCRNNINVVDVDYIVISYLGDFQLRFKNTISTDKPYGRSLYLEIQSLRIALIDEHTKQIWRRNYMVFNNGVKVIGGYLLFKYVLNFFGINYYNWRGLIGM